MTLSLLSEDSLKIRVSPHVACSWTWTLSFQKENDEPAFTLILQKRHPLWELVTEVVSHLPSWLPSWVADTNWYNRMMERHSADIAQVEISDIMVKTLYFPLWAIAHDDED